MAAEELFVASTDETGEEQPVDIAAATESLVVAAKVIAEVTEVAVEQVKDASFAEAINSVVKEALPDTLEETTQVSVTEITEEVVTSVEGAGQRNKPPRMSLHRAVKRSLFRA